VMHEQALVGVQLLGSLGLGTFDAKGSYARQPAGSSDLELEQDLFGALRVFKNAQVALLVPFLEARRTDRSGSEFGGGLGDIAFSARYDFFLAGRSRYLPGIALTAGMALPTGTAPEDASRLGTNATGLGVVQGSFALSLEQTFGDWLVSLIGLVALRADRTVAGMTSSLAPQWAGIAGVAYTFKQGASLGFALQYSAEGDATFGGVTQPDSARRRTLLTLSGFWPLTDAWHLRGSLNWDPPIDSLGMNQLQNTGAALTVVYAWL
jgi:hypothetical protein